MPPGHDADDAERLHKGPRVGRHYFVACSRPDGTFSTGELVAQYGSQSPDLTTPDEIREADEHLLAAADWLEAQR